MGRSPFERAWTGRSECQRRPNEVIPIAERSEDERGQDPASQGPEDPGDPSERREPPSTEQVHEELAAEILRIHEESYGKGARLSQAIVAGDFVTVILDDIELLPNEKFLVESGRGDTVHQVRTQYQLAIRSSFTAAVERATGRTVIGFVSATAVDEPRFVVETFKLQ
jgi:uncharacterized protein YbcI